MGCGIVMPEIGLRLSDYAGKPNPAELRDDRRAKQVAGDNLCGTAKEGGWKRPHSLFLRGRRGGPLRAARFGLASWPSAGAAGSSTDTTPTSGSSGGRAIE